MNRGVIVAALSDLAFATKVRDALGSVEIQIATEIGNFSAAPILLLWSSSLSVSGGQVQGLVSLWAEGQLTIARRDETALPLGLGDLDSLPPGAPVERVVEQFAACIDHRASKTPQPTLASHSAASMPPVPAAKRTSRHGWGLGGATAGLAIIVVVGFFAFRQDLPSQGSREVSPKAVAAPSLEPGTDVRNSRTQSADSAPASSQGSGAVYAEELRGRELAERARALEEAERRQKSDVDSASKRPRIAEDNDDANRRIATLERELEELRRQRGSERLGAATTSDRFATWIAVAVAGSVGVTAFGFWAFRHLRGRIPSAAFDPVNPGVNSHRLASEPGRADALFISYAHADLQLIEPVLSELDALGRQVWIDRSGMTGAPGWAGQIVGAIKRSRAVILMASPRAYASHHVVRELYLAMSNQKPIVPLELEKAELPDELAYILAPFQRHPLTGDRRPILVRALDAV